MDLFSIFTLFGGLAFFLYGMHTMSLGLEKMSGGKLEKALKKMTSNPIKSLILGAGITVAIQSSSAMTVMLVGFVNSGIMELGQTIGVIMGSNIGTTLTAWILSMAGVETDNIIIKLLTPEAFAPIMALIGIVFITIKKDGPKKDIGSILVGFSILMTGMTLMSDAVSPLADMPQFAHILIAFKNPLLGVLVGTVFTGIIQSSAASVGILQALSLTGNITYGMAIPIIMGQNIGTCVTALLSSIGVSKNAKRVAVVHISFNIIGTAIWLIVYFIAHLIFSMPWLEGAISPVGIAGCHSIFNIVTTAMLLPFTKQLEWLAKTVIKDQHGDEDKQGCFLDERLMNTPSVAIGECKERTIRMACLAQENLKLSVSMLSKYDDKLRVTIEENEDLIDQYEDKIGTYLVKLGSKPLSEAASKEVSKMLHIIGDFERIGDHALNICEIATEYDEKKLGFSKEAKRQLKIMTDAVDEVIKLTIRAYENNDEKLAKKVEPLEQVIDDLRTELKLRHVERLRKGECTIEQGFIFSDLLTNYERISDHCSNVAVCMIKVNEDSFETHEYLQKLRMDKGGFKTDYTNYQLKYALDPK